MIPITPPITPVLRSFDNMAHVRTPKRGPPPTYSNSNSHGSAPSYMVSLRPATGSNVLVAYFTTGTGRAAGILKTWGDWGKTGAFPRYCKGLKSYQYHCPLQCSISRTSNMPQYGNTAVFRRFEGMLLWPSGICRGLEEGS